MFSLDPAETSQGVGANALWVSPRRQLLQFRESFYQCTQHDHKAFDFGGHAIPTGGIASFNPAMAALYSTAPQYVPIEQRRPSAPYRLARVIVQEFTGLVHDAKAITDDLDARYTAFAKAETYMIQHALVIPCFLNVYWELTCVNDYSKVNVAYGVEQYRYINWETNDQIYTTEDYAGFIAAFNGAAQ